MSANNARYINPNNPLPEDQYHRNVQGLFDTATKGLVSHRAVNVSTVTLANGDTILVGDEAVSLSGGTGATDVTATGTISAAQPSINTPVANASVTLALGNGEATWLAEIVGPISSGTTLVFDQSEDNSIFNQAVGYDATNSSGNPPAIASISGPLASGSAFAIRGLASGIEQIKIRASTLHAGDSFTVKIIASLGSLAIGGGFSSTDSTNLSGTKTDLDSIVSNTAIAPGTAVDVSTSQTNAICTATMPAVVGKTNYLTGYEITGMPATVLSSGDVTISGLASTLTAEFAESTTGQSSLIVSFGTYPRPASGADIAISVSVAALGASSGKVSVNVHGFYQ